MIREFVFLTIREVRRILWRKNRLTANSTGTTASTASASRQLKTNITMLMPVIRAVPQTKSITPQARIFDSR